MSENSGLRTASACFASQSQQVAAGARSDLLHWPRRLYHQRKPRRPRYRCSHPHRAQTNAIRTLLKALERLRGRSRCDPRILIAPLSEAELNRHLKSHRRRSNRRGLPGLRSGTSLRSLRLLVPCRRARRRWSCCRVRLHASGSRHRWTRDRLPCCRTGNRLGDLGECSRREGINPRGGLAALRCG
jgi:hypothetical protein